MVKQSLCARETMAEIENNQDEFIRFYAHMNLGRSCEVPDKVSTVADLFSLHLDESLSNTFVSKSFSFKRTLKTTSSLRSFQFSRRS
jgi:hypothetical protein